MRDIRFCDDQGNVLRDLGGGGLSTEIWRELYPRLAGDPERPILAGLWREQWGPEADATLPPSEVEALASELESLSAEFGDETPTAVRGFLDDLAGLCAEAVDRGAGLRFIAD